MLKGRPMRHALLLSRLRDLSRNNARGLTLVEVVIVLGVFSVIVAAIWLVVSVVYENVRQYNAIRSLQTIVQNARQLWTRVPQLTGTVTNYTTTLDSQAAFPLEMRYTAGSATGVLNHAWANSSSGTVTVTYSDADTFVVTFSSLPRKACIGLATRLSGGEVTNLEGVRIGTTTYSGTSLPLTVVTANIACTSDTSNTISWYFNIRA